MSENIEYGWEGEAQNGEPPPMAAITSATPLNNSSVNGASVSSSAARDSEGGNVDKIRDILFGAQMRDYDRRFSSLEDRLLQEAATLRDEVARRLSAADQFVRNELDDLSSRLTTEQRERTQALREAMDALTTVNRELSERIAALAEQSAQQHRELRQALAEQHRTLDDEGGRRHQELATAIRRESADLRNAKTDRTALAAMFAEFAHRLSIEPDGR
ncbi:MAG: hypothetical protein ABIT38_15170 [Gemmatimonadaceae bacterium]